MCRASLVLFAFLSHALAQGTDHLAEKVFDHAQDSLDKLVNKLVDTLVERTPVGLEETTLGKPSHATAPQVATKEYDYIIVGAGAAGSLLARRLGDAGKKVLVLEKGDKKESILKTIPASVVKLFVNPKYDYMLESENEKHLNGRGVYLIRGKMVGGSSGCNVMIYHRGTAKDYDDHWPEGWKSQDNLEYFKRFERYRSKLVGKDSKYHGYKGDLQVEDVNYQNKLSDAFINSGVEYGMERNKDFNDWSRPQEGIGKFQVTSKNGRRQDSYAAFLKGAPGSVTLMTGMSVLKITFAADNVATGVLFADENGKQYTASVKAGGEVILSAGAVMSPEILQASGIGPEKELAKQDIKTRVNLPGVGKNLQDQPGVSLQYNVKKNISITNEMFIKKTSTVSPISLFRWIFNGRGPLTSPGCEQGGFFKTRQGLIDPNLQIRFVPARGTSSDAVKTYTNLGKIPPAPSGIAMQIVAIRPESTGSVMIRDGKASSKPVINVNYLDTKEDRRTLREGLKLARQLVAQKSLQEHVLDEVWPGKHVQTDEELDRYIAETVHSTNAVVGTCKMGTPSVFDNSAVVDTSLRVIGTKNLRVVDASVFPKVPGGQTAAPTYMVAEKAADIILQRGPQAASASS
eukprot:gnl/MRDRNA2_/MRDRNA2_119595_c0_seq1.p1 gnl/MRDRNA2_/MRDRNA2_119595_c0~~gnl/MRDRNA2_/MRDRNA2_119595_c0_seq1.p1  ORF type:complete len:630 (+),score=107.76 gnl/MRDRNA2_/MRDRNA2_119595_c0_seq1:91-1980(+)